MHIQSLANGFGIEWEPPKKIATLRSTSQTTEKTLYDYQLEDLGKIFACLEESPDDINLLYQLPTGGGKTVVFSEIARRYIAQKNKKVVVMNSDGPTLPRLF